MFAATSVETALLPPGICFSHAGLFPAVNTTPTYQAIWDQKCLIHLLIPSNEKVTGCVTSVPEQTEIQILKRKNSPEFRHRSFCSWWYLKKVTELKLHLLSGRTRLPVVLSMAWTSLSSTRAKAGFSTHFRSYTAVPMRVRNGGEVREELSNPTVSLQQWQDLSDVHRQVQVLDKLGAQKQPLWDGKWTCQFGFAKTTF